jgi:hypothetical protein
MQSKHDQLKAALEKMGFKPIIAPIAEDNRIDALQIHFNSESRDEELTLIFSLFSPREVSILLQEEIKFSLLNILCFLPLSFDGQSIKEAGLLANRINAMAVFPGFGTDNNAKVFYRYSLPLAVDINQDLLKAAIHLIMSTLDIYGEPFSQIAEGKPYVEVVEEALSDYLDDLQKLSIGKINKEF